MAQSFTNLLYHIVFSTKNREPLISVEVESRLHAYLGGLVRGLEGIALEINGMPDHVHLLAKLSQNRAIKDVLRDLKADSSGWVQNPSRSKELWLAIWLLGVYSKRRSSECGNTFEIRKTIITK